MGRFGNFFLTNGEPVYSKTIGGGAGAVVRYYFTNVSNTRTFNLSFTNAKMKLIGGDGGDFERNENQNEFHGRRHQGHAYRTE